MILRKRKISLDLVHINQLCIPVFHDWHHSKVSNYDWILTLGDTPVQIIKAYVVRWVLPRSIAACKMAGHTCFYFYMNHLSFFWLPQNKALLLKGLESEFAQLVGHSISAGKITLPPIPNVVLKIQNCVPLNPQGLPKLPSAYSKTRPYSYSDSCC